MRLKGMEEGAAWGARGGRREGEGVIRMQGQPPAVSAPSELARHVLLLFRASSAALRLSFKDRREKKRILPTAKANLGWLVFF